MSFHHEPIKYDLNDLVDQGLRSKKEKVWIKEDKKAKRNAKMTAINDYKNYANDKVDPPTGMDKELMMLVREILMHSDVCLNVDMATAEVESLTLVKESVPTVDIHFFMQPRLRFRKACVSSESCFQ